MADRSPRLVSASPASTTSTAPSKTTGRWVRTKWIVTFAWGWTAIIGLLAASQVIGYTGFPVLYVMQALTPFVLAPSLPIALFSERTGRHRLALVNTVIAGVLLWLAVPVVFHGDPPAVSAQAPRLTIRFANAYYGNDRIDEAATSLLSTDTDVIAIVEYPQHLEQALDRLGAFESYPYRLGRSSPDRGGIALLSRYPVLASSFERFGDQPGIEAVLDVHGTSVRVIVVHPLAATDPDSFETWEGDLRVIAGRISESGLPTVVVGDFNASRWHPDFRDLLDESGARDVHEWLGHGFSTSWPADVLVPPFVRIDHALVRGRAVPLSIHNVDTPGSDHRGFVVAVAIAG